MTVDEIRQFAEDLLDGETIESTLANKLANHFKDLIESSRRWMMLIKENSSKTFGPSDTYETSKDLPDDFILDDSIRIGDGDSSTPYDPIRFQQRRQYLNSGNKYCIDWANSNYYIHGSESSTKTIYFYYIYNTGTLADSDSPVWPARFHKIIAFLIADIYLAGIDAGEMTINAAMAHSKQGSALFKQMENWDDELILKAQGGKAGIRDINEPYHTRVDVNS